MLGRKKALDLLQLPNVFIPAWSLLTGTMQCNYVANTSIFSVTYIEQNARVNLQLTS